MVPMAPPQSVVHQIVQAELSEAKCQAIDAAMHQDKLVDGWAQRNFKRAMDLQMRGQGGNHA